MTDDKAVNARHSEVTIHGTAGRLEGLMWRPEKSQPIAMAAAVCHPHPLYQGTMHNKVVYQAAKLLDSLGIPVLRFNFRGVGASEGSYDNGRGEEDDLRAVLDYLTAEYPGVPLMAAGFSFGAWIGLRLGCSDRRVVELIGLGLPIDDRKLSFEYLRDCTKPKLLVQGESDQFGARPRFQAFVDTFSAEATAATRIAFIPSADHFFTGHLEEMAAALREWITGRHPNLRFSAPKE